MNERIRELAEQANKWSSEEFHRLFLNGIDVAMQELFNEKFAELIIADIGQIVSGLIVPETWEQDIGPYEHWNRALATVASEIEQHFYGQAE
jgi:hypothetical protein